MVAIIVSTRVTGIRMRFISSVRSVLRLVVLLVAIASLGISAGADATEDARRKIGAEMAAGVQNNIPFRRWGTWQDDYKVHLATKITETTIIDPGVHHH